MLICQNENRKMQETHMVLLLGTGANSINVKTMHLLKKNQKHKKKNKVDQSHCSSLWTTAGTDYWSDNFMLWIAPLTQDREKWNKANVIFIFTSEKCIKFSIQLLLEEKNYYKKRTDWWVELLQKKPLKQNYYQWHCHTPKVLNFSCRLILECYILFCSNCWYWQTIPFGIWSVLMWRVYM